MMPAGLLGDGKNSQEPAIDAGTPRVPFVSGYQNSFGNGNDTVSSASAPDDAFASPTTAPQNLHVPLSLMDAYLQYVKQLNANQSQTPAIDTSAPAAWLLPTIQTSREVFSAGSPP
jgi:hypothetical protein